MADTSKPTNKSTEKTRTTINLKIDTVVNNLVLPDQKKEPPSQRFEESDHHSDSRDEEDKKIYNTRVDEPNEEQPKRLA